ECSDWVGNGRNNITCRKMILPLVSPLVGRDQFDMVLLGFEAGCRVDPIGEHQAEDACAKVRFQLLDDAGEFLDLTRMNVALDFSENNDFFSISPALGVEIDLHGMSIRIQIASVKLGHLDTMVTQQIAGCDDSCDVF